MAKIKKNKYKISVVIATYNHAHCITNMLDCLQKQKIALEIIVVNDCSTDNTIEVVEEWQKNNSTPLLLVNNTEKHFTLKSRLKGCTYAKTETIMFVDSDDILLGTKRLKRAYEIREKENADIVHFRSRYALQDKTEMGEALFASPFFPDINTNKTIFDTYWERSYPSLLLWGKLYSRALIERVTPIAFREACYAFDDKFLSTLLMLYAKSYKTSDEYIYHYYLRENHSVDLYVRRLSALLMILRVLPKHMKEQKVKTSTKEKCLSFYHNRLAISAGHLCNKLEKENFENNEEFLAHAFQFISEEDFFAILLFSINYNISKLEKIATYLDVFPFDIRSKLEENNIKDSLMQEIFSLCSQYIEDNNSLEACLQNKEKLLNAMQSDKDRQELFLTLFTLNSRLAKKIQNIHAI